MKPNFIFSFLLALALSFATAAVAQTPSAPIRPGVGLFDFQYEIGGDSRALPLNVFDDGTYTYFQFREGAVLPAIFGATLQGPVLLQPQSAGPYVRVPAVAREFILQMGRAQARIAYGGPARRNGVAVMADAPPISAPVPVASEVKPVNPADWKSHSYATPVAGDVVSWSLAPSKPTLVSIGFPRGDEVVTVGSRATLQAIAEVADQVESVHIIGRDDPSELDQLADRRAKVIESELIALGVPPSKITKGIGAPIASSVNKGVWVSTVAYTLRARAPAEKPMTPWTQQSPFTAQISVPEVMGLAVRPPVPAPALTLQPADRTVPEATQRWAKAAGWGIQWDLPATISERMRITSDASYDPAFDVAVGQVVAGLQALGYPIRATVHPNKFIRIGVRP